MSRFTDQATDQFVIGLGFYVLRLAHLASGFGNQLARFQCGHVFTGTTPAKNMVSCLLSFTQNQGRTTHHAFVQRNAFIAVTNNMMQRACLAECHKAFAKRLVELATERFSSMIARAFSMGMPRR